MSERVVLTQALESAQKIQVQDFTERQQIFMNEYLEGRTQTEAARRAGYKQPEQQAWNLLRVPKIAAYIRAEQARKLATDGVRVGINTLLSIAQDEAAPKAARVQAANSLLDRAGLTARVAEAAQGLHERPLSEMTIHELQAVVAEERERLANSQAIEAEVVEVRNDGAQSGASD